MVRESIESVTHASWRIDLANRSRNATWVRDEESKKEGEKKRNSEM